MKQLPPFISIIFILTTVATVLFFYNASRKNKKVLFALCAWLLLQMALGLSGFFTITHILPPRFLLLVLSPLFVVILLFSTARGKSFIDHFNIKTLTILHSIRIAVELILFSLFLYKATPQLMTFEGRNLDVLSGLTAPLIYYYGFVKESLGTKTLLAWNIACLAILSFTVVNAVLSAPTPFQQFAFDQPNIAVLYFPFVWLPGTIVPLVYFSHLASIRRLLKEIKAKTASGFVATG
jgi:hypothetical protein